MEQLHISLLPSSSPLAFDACQPSQQHKQAIHKHVESLLRRSILAVRVPIPVGSSVLEEWHDDTSFPPRILRLSNFFSDLLRLQSECYHPPHSSYSISYVQPLPLPGPFFSSFSPHNQLDPCHDSSLSSIINPRSTSGLHRIPLTPNPPDSPSLPIVQSPPVPTHHPDHEGGRGPPTVPQRARIALPPHGPTPIEVIKGRSSGSLHLHSSSDSDQSVNRSIRSPILWSCGRRVERGNIDSLLARLPTRLSSAASAHGARLSRPFTLHLRRLC